MDDSRIEKFIWGCTLLTERLLSKSRTEVGGLSDFGVINIEVGSVRIYFGSYQAISSLPRTVKTLRVLPGLITYASNKSIVVELTGKWLTTVYRLFL
jgi:hypothetical protein